MRELRDDARLAHEPLDVAALRIVQRLDRDVLPGPLVERAMDHPHPASPYALEQSKSIVDAILQASHHPTFTTDKVTLTRATGSPSENTSASANVTDLPGRTTFPTHRSAFPLAGLTKRTCSSKVRTDWPGSSRVAAATPAV